MTHYTVTYFCNMDLLEKWFGYKRQHVVSFADVAEIEANDALSACDEAFHLWNANRPDHYVGPSMSVGDVCRVQSATARSVWTCLTAPQFFACSASGWDEIEPPVEMVRDDDVTLVNVLEKETERITSQRIGEINV